MRGDGRIRTDENPGARPVSPHAWGRKEQPGQIDGHDSRFPHMRGDGREMAKLLGVCERGFPTCVGTEVELGRLAGWHVAVSPHAWGRKEKAVHAALGVSGFPHMRGDGRRWHTSQCRWDSCSPHTWGAEDNGFGQVKRVLSPDDAWISTAIPNAIRVNPPSACASLAKMVLRPAIRDARPGEDHVGIDSPGRRRVADRG